MTDASSLSGIIAGMLTLSPVWAGAGHAGVCGEQLTVSSSPPRLRLSGSGSGDSDHSLAGARSGSGHISGN